MIVKIKRQDCLALYPWFPQVDNLKETFFSPKAISHYKLALDSKSAKGHAKSLSTSLVLLLENMNIETVIFLGDTECAWRFQENVHPPVQEALIYLENNKIGKKFDGGLRIALDELSNFSKHLFWLVRCNAALPVFHFADPCKTIVGSICQFGNLHFDSLNKKADRNFQRALAATTFYPVDKCYSTFSKSSRINNRQSIIRN